jgi:hypothetical protein
VSSFGKGASDEAKVTAENTKEVGGEAAGAAKDIAEDVKKACEGKAKQKVYGGCGEICGRMSVSGSPLPRVQFHGGLVELGRDALWRAQVELEDIKNSLKGYLKPGQP